MSHTKEKIVIRDHYGPMLRIGDVQYTQIAIVLSTDTSISPDEAREHARRFASCWNSLLPFKTEEIEAGIDLLKLAQERDEVLEALRISTNGLRRCSRWNISEETEKTIITQVIANESILAKHQKVTG